MASVEPPTPPSGAPPAGWYPDPDSPRVQQRYWDGLAWTDQRAPLASPPAPTWVVGAGYVLSVTVIFGLVFGVWLAARRDRNAPWVLGLTVFFLVLWIVLGLLGDAE